MLEDTSFAHGALGSRRRSSCPQSGFGAWLAVSPRRPSGLSRRSTLKGVGSAAQDSGWRFGQGLAVQLCWGQLGRRTWGSRVRARACVWTAAGPRGCLLPGAPASAAGEPTPVCRWWAGLPVSRCPWSATAPAPGDGRCLHLLSGRACGYGSPPWGAGRGDVVSTSHIATSGQTTAHLCTNAVVGVKERRGTAGRCACPGLSRGDLPPVPQRERSRDSVSVPLPSPPGCRRSW